MEGPRNPEEARIHSYRDLRVWQQAMDLADACYWKTQQFPKEELYSMASQIRRAATSVPANIAEGQGRESRGEFVRFLHVAQGSLKELETHLLQCQRVERKSAESVREISHRRETVGKMLRALIRSLQKNE